MGRDWREPLAELMQAAMERLEREDGEPKFGDLPDHSGWHRHQQELFLALRSNVWLMPDKVAHIGWLESFPQMQAVRDAVAADQGIADSVDACVGVEFRMVSRRFDWLLVQQVLEPLIVAARAYRFDRPVFDDLAARLDAGLRQATVRIAEFMPLSGFVCSLDEVALPGGLLLGPATDRQIHHAIQARAVIAEIDGHPNRVRVPRTDQWVLMRETEHEVHTERSMPDVPRAPAFPSFEEPAERIVRALRLVCGGTVVATRPIMASYDPMFPYPVDLGSISLGVPTWGDENQPTMLLNTATAADVVALFEKLAHPAVIKDGALQLAIRRVLLAAPRRHPEDQLIDLAIAAEALFVKRGKRGRDKGPVFADEAESLLANDPALSAKPGDVREFLRAAYRLRNKVIHGDLGSTTTMLRLDLSSTTVINEVTTDWLAVMRRALVVAVEQAARGSAPETSSGQG